MQPLDGWDGDQGVDLWVFADPPQRRRTAPRSPSPTRTPHEPDRRQRRRARHFRRARAARPAARRPRRLPAVPTLPPTRRGRAASELLTETTEVSALKRRKSRLNVRRTPHRRARARHRSRPARRRSRRRTRNPMPASSWPLAQASRSPRGAGRRGRRARPPGPRATTQSPQVDQARDDRAGAPQVPDRGAQGAVRPALAGRDHRHRAAACASDRATRRRCAGRRPPPWRPIRRGRRRSRIRSGRAAPAGRRPSTPAPTPARGSPSRSDRPGEHGTALGGVRLRSLVLPPEGEDGHPRSTATVSVVVNDSTSTTTAVPVGRRRQPPRSPPVEPDAEVLLPMGSVERSPLGLDTRSVATSRRSRSLLNHRRSHRWRGRPHQMRRGRPVDQSPSPSDVANTSWNSSRLRTMLARNSGGLWGRS